MFASMKLKRRIYDAQCTESIGICLVKRLGIKAEDLAKLTERHESEIYVW